LAPKELKFKSNKQKKWSIKLHKAPDGISARKQVFYTTSWNKFKSNKQKKWSIKLHKASDGISARKQVFCTKGTKVQIQNRINKRDISKA